MTIPRIEEYTDADLKEVVRILKLEPTPHVVLPRPVKRGVSSLALACPPHPLARGNLFSEVVE